VDAARPRLGVLGGSFDPPHLGHLVIASEACARHGLERVLFAPAAAPPHKVAERSTPARIRLEMTALAVAGDERFAVSEIEMERGLTFTRDTLAAIAARHPEHDLAFIMGSDSLLQFETWHDPVGVLGLSTLLVAVRPGDDREAVAAAAGRWGPDAVVVMDAPPIGVSSSALRARVAAGLPIRYLVPAAVEVLVRERGLYRAS
jgi:nicotinate-nucleotide adenylyltransferase